MDNQMEKVYSGILVEHEEEISLHRLCRFCNHTQEEIIELVNEGILEPMGTSKHEWRFTFSTVSRVKKVRRLQKDFELNLPASGLVIHLLDRIEELESMLKSFGR